MRKILLTCLSNFKRNLVISSWMFLSAMLFWLLVRYLMKQTHSKLSMLLKVPADQHILFTWHGNIWTNCSWIIFIVLVSFLSLASTLLYNGEYKNFAPILQANPSDSQNAEISISWSLTSECHWNFCSKFLWFSGGSLFWVCRVFQISMVWLFPWIVHI